MTWVTGWPSLGTPSGSLEVTQECFYCGQWPGKGDGECPTPTLKWSEKEFWKAGLREAEAGGSLRVHFELTVEPRLPLNSRYPLASASCVLVSQRCPAMPGFPCTLWGTSLRSVTPGLPTCHRSGCPAVLRFGGTDKSLHAFRL